MLYRRTFFFFFFNDTATTEIYTLSLHDALPIYSFATSTIDEIAGSPLRLTLVDTSGPVDARRFRSQARSDRKSTRLNSSHSQISYAVFCLKKKNTCSNLPRLPPDTCLFPRPHTS